MRAITVSTERGFSMEERPTPAAGPGQVVVKVRSAGLNSADLQQARGFYNAPLGWPADITGLEIAGEIAAVGDGVLDHAIGDRVMALIGGGGHAEQVVVPADLLVSLPDSLDWAHAGAVMEGYATSLDALVLQGRVRAGDRVLVTGAAGGVGLSMVQVALANGAFVTASVRNAEAASALAEFVQSDRCTVVAPDGEAASGPYDIIIDLVCGNGFLDRVGLLAPDGKLIIVGILAPMDADVGTAWLGPLLLNRCSVIGTTIRGRSPASKVALTREIARSVVPLLESGTLRVHLDSTFDFEDFGSAFAKLAAPGKVGKIVLTNR
jgi:NADPH2:quinone reductase